MARSAWISEFFGREKSTIPINNLEVIKKTSLGGTREDVVVGFDNIEQRVVRMSNKVARSICERDRFLEQIVIQFLNREDSIYATSASSNHRFVTNIA